MDGRSIISCPWKPYIRVKYCNRYPAIGIYRCPRVPPAAGAAGPAFTHRGVLRVDVSGINNGSGIVYGGK